MLQTSHSRGPRRGFPPRRDPGLPGHAFGLRNLDDEVEVEGPGVVLDRHRDAGLGKAVDGQIADLLAQVSQCVEDIQRGVGALEHIQIVLIEGHAVDDDAGALRHVAVQRIQDALQVLLHIGVAPVANQIRNGLAAQLVGQAQEGLVADLGELQAVQQLDLVLIVLLAVQIILDIDLGQLILQHLVHLVGDHGGDVRSASTSPS